MKTVSRVFETLLPSAEELWDRSDHEMRTIEIEPGRYIDVPVFDIEVDEGKTKTLAEKEIVSKRGKRLGKEITQRLILTDGTDYLARAHVLDHATADMTVTSGAAWTTTIDGYAAKRAREIRSEAGVDVLQVGPGHSASLLPYGMDVFRLGKTLVKAPSISLAKTAQTEQAIFDSMSRRFGLSKNQYAIGDSRDSMTTPGQFAYVDMYGANLMHFDTKAPCAPDRVEMRDLPRFGRWLATEAVGGAAIIGTLILQGEGRDLAGTTSLNPNFIASAFVGEMPALAAGEAGQMVDWVPHDANGHIVIYSNDLMSDPERWDELWQDHPNIHRKHVDKGIHASLLQRKARIPQVLRIARAAEELSRTSNDSSTVDWSYVHHGRRDLELAA